MESFEMSPINNGMLTGIVMQILLSTHTFEIP